MGKRSWFLHLAGKTSGPFLIESLQEMIRDQKIGFSDFIWSPELKTWTRLSEMSEFQSLLPPFPQVPPPQPEANKESPKESKTKKAPTSLKTSFKGKIEVKEFGLFMVLNLAENGVYVAGDVSPPI